MNFGMMKCDNLVNKCKFSHVVYNSIYKLYFYVSGKLFHVKDDHCKCKLQVSFRCHGTWVICFRSHIVLPSFGFCMCAPKYPSLWNMPILKTSVFKKSEKYIRTCLQKIQYFIQIGTQQFIHNYHVFYHIVMILSCWTSLLWLGTLD